MVWPCVSRPMGELTNLAMITLRKQGGGVEKNYPGCLSSLPWGSGERR